MTLGQNIFRRLLLVSLLLLATLSAGCGFLFFDGDPKQVCTEAHDVCAQKCETYCDFLLCWDECYDDCWHEPAVCVDVPSKGESDTEEETTTTTTTTTTDEETTTTTTCEGSGCYTPERPVTPKPTPGRCYNDGDCDGRQICIRGVCEQRDTTHRGTAGLCQVCENSNDCFEQGAKCIQINYDPVRRVGEKICGRLCELNSDCPPSFQCVKSSNTSNATSQCIPVVQSTDSGDVRTCNSTPQLQCVRASDCAAGQSCINNRCERPSTAECTGDRECQGGAVCRGQRCVTPPNTARCTFNSDCEEGAVCLSGTCRRETRTCRRREDCSANQFCNDGRCFEIQCHYSSDCDMGEVCANARCTKTCRNNRDCEQGSTCNNLGYCA